jgi:hypothetical protein
VGVGPVEADGGGLGGEALGALEGGEGAGDAVEEAAAVGLFALLPGLLDGLGGVEGGVAEDVGVAGGHLVAELVEDGFEVEGAALVGEVGVEGEEEGEVAELLAEGVVVLGVEGVEDLVGLFDEVGGEALVGLAAVPRAAMLGVAQAGDEVLEALGGVGHGVGLAA